MDRSAATASPLRLRAARVLRAHGVRGELRVEPLGSDARRFTPGLRLHREAEGGQLTVRSARQLGDGAVLLSLDEVRSRTEAEQLRDAYLCVDASDARGLGEDEWFVHQLVGLQAVTPEGTKLGAVVDVESSPAHDVLVIAAGTEEQRLPMTREFVRRVDVERGVVEVTPWATEP
jgi:16S rRNA processing protein RimM